MKESNITAADMFGRVAEIAVAEGAAANRMMHEALAVLCHEGLKGSGRDYGNLFSQVDSLCRKYRMKPAEIAAVQQMRRDSNRTEPLDSTRLAQDCRALSLLVSAVTGQDVPAYVLEWVPALPTGLKESRKIDRTYVRCSVVRLEDGLVRVAADQDAEDGETLVALEGEPNDHSYLAEILRPGMQLNLLDCSVRGDGALEPGIVVVEPDFLVDISSLANCFEDFGHHPLMYIVNRMKPRANTRYTILGNFAGSALDDIINNPAYSMADTMRTNFREKAVEYATCADLDISRFKADAAMQVQNIATAVDLLFRGKDKGKALLEPSFVCEKLGLAGRVDLMTSNIRPRKGEKVLLVEQKSGSNIYLARNTRNSHGSLYVEKHYVQVLLYYGILRYNFNLRPSSVDVNLLYSKYPAPAGILYAAPYAGLFDEAMRLRNLIVAAETSVARDGFEAVLGNLDVETLNTENDNSYFFTRYLKPQIEETTLPLAAMDDLTRAYFCRMAAFVEREQMMSKTGAQEGVGNSAADLWNMPLAEKLETGNIFMSMEIASKKKSLPTGGYDLITLSVPQQGDDFLPNFRRGDMVYLYSYFEGDEPDARRSILFKGTLAGIKTDSITVHLNDGQQNPRVFDNPYEGRRRMFYAVEHGSSDIGTSSAMQSLFALATSGYDRRALLLGQRCPRRDPSKQLSRAYSPDYDDIVLRSKQAQDYFLLVGPPGTGKTSMALRFIVEEELSGEGTSVLLMSYTNRAVDEICAMLCSAGIDFLRMGNEFSCDERFRPYLVSNAVESNPRLSGLKQRIGAARVVVGTTSTLMARPFIFATKRFTLAVVDEAGQITEPNIIGLLAANTAGQYSEPVIGRFILVGDYKQLPAVVQQDEACSAVESPLLKAIGLRNCRDSLFERLIRHEHEAGRTDFVGILRKQGRMHPTIAEFPNRMFYFNEHLVPVPCPHQQEEALGYEGGTDDAMGRVLKLKRMVFAAVKRGSDGVMSDKVNVAEAAAVADILKRIKDFYGCRFDPQKTVGVIVPYRNQIAMVRKAMARIGLEGMDNVSIDTVERYQGSQRDVIIYSFTVSRRWQLEFLTANSIVEDGRTIDRKLNVAITRARRQMIMTGDPEVLGHNKVFGSLIGFVKERGGYLEIESRATKQNDDISI